jgi:uncharacterized protein DUF5916/cellulose/xylan binding protein with CBM9 domain
MAASNYAVHHPIDKQSGWSCGQRGLIVERRQQLLPAFPEIAGSICRTLYASLSFAILSLAGMCGLVQAQLRPEFVVPRATTPPLIDGSLTEDEVWKESPLGIDDFVSYNPLYGEKQKQRTEVRIAYDDRNIYFSFHCYDPEPDKIRTTVSRRDNIFNDDWVGISLDAGSTGQFSYHMMVNPSGIQMDALNSSASGENWDVDWVWTSAGRITKDGYVVEIALPLQSVRFKGGPEVRMGILFWRRISRTGVSAAWPDIPPGKWVFDRHVQLVFKDLHQPRLLELLPSATYSINQDRLTSNQWSRAAHKGDLGLEGKFGLTSTITLDATVNPDFSQVESDAFQVEVNQRFPIFFSEKRPFFMEGMSIFSIAGNPGDGNMNTAVHTRRIVNPIFGAKLTGNMGKTSWGFLSASDQSPPELFTTAASNHKDKLFTIGRALYSLGQSNYVGTIITDTEFAGHYNRVAGGDLSLRLQHGQQVTANFFSTHSGAPEEESRDGIGGGVYYDYSRRWGDLSGQIEHYAKDFQMDTAFYNRTGITGGWAYGALNYYPEPKGLLWIKRITPFVWTKHYRDQVQNGNDDYFQPGIRFNFTRQGFLRFDQSWGHEPWANYRFKSGRRRIMGNAQILPWLHIDGEANLGWATFYDPVSPFQGRSTSKRLELVFQPNSKINEDIFYNIVKFDRASTGERVYTIHIANFKSTYQFNKHFFVRGIAQFDSSQSRVLTDLLASYEWVPGTVAQAGYGSLIEKRRFEDGILDAGGGSYLTVHRGLFFKLSYLHRF